MSYKILPKEYPKIFELYDTGISQREIAELYGVATDTIEKIFKRSGIKGRTRVHSVNESYFKKVDTPNKAYFLGLLYSDGWVGKGYFGISLQEEDGYIIEEFKKDIEFNGPILHIDKGEGRKFQKRIEICSKSMIEDLFKLGIYKNKSLTLQFPTNEIVPIEFMNHFLRGSFDGDGSIIFNKERLVSGITSSKDFCNGLNSFCKENLNINSFVKCDGRSEAFDIKFSTRPSLVFLNYIYKEDGPKLNRKYKRFVDALFESRLKNQNRKGGSSICDNLIKSIINDPKFCLLD